MSENNHRSEDPSIECAARKQSLPEPADCDWPYCACDEKACNVVDALLEHGWLVPGEAQRLIYEHDRLRAALERIKTFPHWTDLPGGHIHGYAGDCGACVAADVLSDAPPFSPEKIEGKS